MCFCGALSVEDLEPRIFAVGWCRHSSRGHVCKEMNTVSSLFNAGAIQIVVASIRSVGVGMTMSAHLVVITGSQCFEGCEHRCVDLPIADVAK